MHVLVYRVGDLAATQCESHTWARPPGLTLTARDATIPMRRSLREHQMQERAEPMQSGEVRNTVERAIADLIRRFERMPDALLREVDLLATLFHILQREPSLRQPYLTRDGRRTTLLHRDYPVLLQKAGAAGSADAPARYDLAILEPGFVQSHELGVVANLRGQGMRVYSGEPFAEKPPPLLAAIDLRLVEGFTPEAMGRLGADLGELVYHRGESGACYVAIFCRHWDLHNHIGNALQVLGPWAEQHRQISMVVVQSHWDRIGPVFGGKYLNLWTHMAPLPPLEASSPPVQ